MEFFKREVLRLSYASILIIILVLSGCKTSNDVVSNSWIQKRKHRAGFHLNIGKTSSRARNPSTISPDISFQPRLKPTKIPSKRLNISILKNELKPKTELVWNHQKTDSKIVHTSTHKSRQTYQYPKESDDEPPTDDEIEVASNKSLIRISVVALLLLGLIPFSLLILFGLLPFIPLLGWIIIAILPTLITVLVYYIVEHFKILRGETMFTKERRKKLLGTAATAFIAGVLSGFVAGLFGLAAWVVFLILAVVWLIGGSGSILLIFGVALAAVAILLGLLSISSINIALIDLILALTRSFRPKPTDQ